jgi:endonuclease YncB( thermonuclease family)
MTPLLGEAKVSQNLPAQGDQREMHLVKILSLLFLIAVAGCQIVDSESGRADAVYVNGLKRTEWQVKKGSVYDGDTFRAIDQTTKEEIKVRLACIDAPEKKQDLGIASRDFLRSLLNKGDKVHLQVVDTDRYGRKVAIAFVPTPKGELAVNGEMVKNGMAYFYRQYSDKCPQKEVYETVEREAKRKKVGVWSRAKSVKPWDYRKAKR